MTAVRTVAIVGAGTMGQRIAFSCALSGIAVRLYDIVPGKAIDAVASARALIETWERDGRAAVGAVERCTPLLSAADTVEDCARDADLAVECVPERVELKRETFAALDRLLPPNAVLASNASAIPGSMLADATQRASRTFSVNFGHVEHRKVEVMAHAETAPAVFEAGIAFIRQLGLVPIPVRGESVGYAINRIWRAVKKETLALLDHGLVTHEDVDRGWMLDWGTPIGPCGLMDRIGLDVVRDIELVYFGASGDPTDRPPPLLERMVADGRLGLKSGEGFYRYPTPAFEQAGFLDG